MRAAQQMGPDQPFSSLRRELTEKLKKSATTLEELYLLLPEKIYAQDESDDEGYANEGTFKTLCSLSLPFEIKERPSSYAAYTDRRHRPQYASSNRR